MCLIQQLLHRFTGELVGSQVNQHQMIIRTAGNDLDITAKQPLAERLRIVHNPLLVYLEIIGERFLEADSLGRDHMHQRASLNAGEDRLIKVELIRSLLVAQDQAAAGSSQGLMGSGGHHIRIGDWRGMQPCRHKAGNMGHIHHQHCANLIRNLTELLKINGAGIRGSACDDHLRLRLQRDLTQLIIIDETIIIHAIGHNMKILPGHIHRTPVCQMPTVIQIHTHNGITWLTDRELHRHIRLCPGMGLHIGVITPKKLFRPVDRQILHNIHTLTAAIIPLPGIPFRILIRKRASHRCHHSLAHPVLGSDQLNVAVLPCLLVHDRLRDLRIHKLYFVQ